MTPEKGRRYFYKRETRLLVLDQRTRKKEVHTA